MYQLDKYTNDVVSSNFKELRNTQVTKVIPENDYLWVATNKGLVKLFEDKVEKFTTQEGLLSNSIRDILITKDKKLWIATSKGVSIFDGITFVNITKEDNLISNNVSSLTLDNTGNVFIGTTAGISVFEKSEKIIEQKPPILNVFQSDTSFNFDAISYNSSSSLFVQYQINNQPWVTTTLNTISFKNFKEGYYTFRVRAKKPNSTWQYSKDYNFSVVIPIYKKRIFIVVIVLVLISIITLFVIYQLQKSKKFNRNLVRAMNEQKKLEKRLNTVRENIAQDFHDDLGNKLASITVLTDILSNKNISTDDKKIVYQIQENSDSLYKGTKDFIWSLNSKSDRLEELVTYLSDFGEEFFHKMNISFTIKKDIKSNIALPYYWSRHLILIFKEAMTNVAKHAKAKECEIQFFCDSAILNITLIDDGIGFLQSENTAHNGLINMKKRAKKINANLTISSSKKGTKISFHTKLPKQGS